MVFGTNAKDIDEGKTFDWGRASADYAKYRDIYPAEFLEEIFSHGICTKGQKILDLGTGTGVLPRLMYHYGADFIGTDIAKNQIDTAKLLSKDINIEYICCPSEKLDFASGTFDAVTAMTCFFYFDHSTLAPMLYSFLKPHGKICIGYLAWLPFEDELALNCEKLILKYNPQWTGHSFKAIPVEIPKEYNEQFTVVTNTVKRCEIPFTRESWVGRLKACRGIEASLSPEKITEFENELMEYLRENAPESFTIAHSYAIAVLEKI